MQVIGGVSGQHQSKADENQLIRILASAYADYTAVTKTLLSLLQVIGGVSGQHQSKAEGHKLMLGNLCLLANTAAMAVYFITAKQLVLKYPPMCVAAWAYITAAVCMGASAAAFVDGNHWQMPRIMWGPLAYWIVVCSIVGYYVVTWATQYLPASQVCFCSCCGRCCTELSSWFA